MAKFDEIIDSLDDDLTKKFHNDLAEGGFYADLVNAEVLVENDIKEIRRAVKTAVNNSDYVTLKAIAPTALRQAIEALESVKPSISTTETTDYISEDTEPRDPQKTQEFMILTQKLIKILDQRDNRNVIPTKLRPEFGEIVKELNEKYGMTLEEIEAKFNVTRKTVGKSIKDSKENDKEKAKLLELRLKDTSGESKAKSRLNIGVEGAFDLIEDHAKSITKARMEEDYTLGNYLNEKYYLAALSKGVSIQVLVENATEAYLRQGEVYKLIMDMEDENTELTRQNRMLQAEIMRLATLNKNLSRTILTINNY